MTTPKSGAGHPLSSVYTFPGLQSIRAPVAPEEGEHCIFASLLQRAFVSLSESFPLGRTEAIFFIIGASSLPQTSCVTLSMPPHQLYLMSLNCEKRAIRGWTEDTWRARAITYKILFQGPHPVPGTRGCSKNIQESGEDTAPSSSDIWGLDWEGS